MTNKTSPLGRSHFAPSDLLAQVPRGARAHRDLIYSAPMGFRPLQLDLYVPEGATGPVACVVWVHGGGFAMGSRLYPPLEWPSGATFQLLIDAGLAVATIDYRHTGEAPFPAQLHDAKAAVRYLRAFADELGIDPGRIGAWGESAGGQLVALLGLVRNSAALEGTEGIVHGSSAVSAVVDFYGTADLATIGSFADRLPPHVRAHFDSVGGPPADPAVALLEGSPIPHARTAASPVAQVSEGAPPFLIVHGDADFIVPISQSEDLVRALRDSGVDVEFVRVPGAGHVFGGTDPMPQLERAVDFLASRLMPASQS